MNTKFTTLILLLLAAQTLFAQEAILEKISLKDGAIEYQFEMDTEEYIFEVCGLEKGEEYYMMIMDDRGNKQCAYKLMPSKVSILEDKIDAFIADGSCMQLDITRFECRSDVQFFFPRLMIYKIRKADEKSTPMLLNENPDAEYLVKEILLGNTCGDVFNITSKGQIGTFSAGSNSIGIEDGIVMSCAPLGQMQGGNPGTGEGGATGQGPGEGNDADLTLLTNRAMRDAAVIEFDFTPVDDFLSFRYVFASDEYCDYAGDNVLFNDGFGFFLSGPGISGPYTNGTNINPGGINVATVPETNEPVTIDNIHWYGAYPQYYVSNVNPLGENPSLECSPVELDQGGCCLTETPFDGFTTVLTAEAAVIPCQTYHIRLVIADAVDEIFGSAVFIEGGSFSIGDGLDYEVIFEQTGSNYLYEGCGDSTGVIQFIRNDFLGTSESSFDYINMPVQTVGTATKNKDYSISFNQAISVPPLPAPGLWFEEITVFSDTIVEQNEWVELALDVPCECDQQNLGFTIVDVNPLQLSNVIDVEICNSGEGVTVTPQLIGGLPEAAENYTGNTEGFLYTTQWTGPDGFNQSWSGPYSDPNLNIRLDITPPDEPGVYQYFFAAFDDCGNTVNDTVNVTIVGEPAGSITGDGFICPNNPETGLPVSLVGPGPWDLEYAIDGVVQPILSAASSPFLLPATVAGEYELISIESFGCSGEVDGVGLVTTPVFSLTPDPSDPACFGTSTGAIDVAVTGGTVPYNYTWSDGQTTQIATAIPQGSYTVTITDANGCTDAVSQSISDPLPLTAQTALVTGTTCAQPNSGAANLTAEGGTGTYSFQWDNGTTAQNPTGLAADTYTVIVSDENGCTTNASIDIPADVNVPQAAASVAGQLTCATTTLNLNGNGSSTGGNFSYQWTSIGGGNITAGDDSLNPTVDQIGTYQLLVTDMSNGCTSTETVEVTNNITPPNPDAGAAALLTCNTTNVTLDGTASTGTSSLMYDWLNGTNTSIGNSPTIQVGNVDTYTLIVTNSDNGCTESATVQVTEDTQLPTAVAGSPETLTCAETTLNLNGNGSSTGDFTYQWTAQNGSAISDNTTLNPAITAPDTYEILVTNTTNGCTETATVIIDQDIVDPTAFAGTDGILTCQDTETGIDGMGSSTGGNFSYEWINSGGVQVSTSLATQVSSADTYTLIVTDTNNGCTSTDEVLIGTDDDTPVSIPGPPQMITCNDAEVSLDGSGSSSSPTITYSWLNSANVEVGTMPILQTTTPDIYTLIVTDSNNGCAAQTPVEVSENTDNPIAMTSAPQILTCVETEFTIDGSNSTGSPNLSFEWSNTGNTTISNLATATVTAPDTYTLLVTNLDNGCTAENTLLIDQDIDQPTADAGATATITCVDTEVPLDAAASAGSNLVFEWTNAANDIISTDASTMTTTAGDFNVLVTNTVNGCFDNAQVTIAEDVDFPVVDAGATTNLTCSTLNAILDASNSTGGDNLSFEWTNANNTMLAAEAMTTVTEPGIYTVIVTNLDNNCVEASTLEITQDITNPTVNAGETQTLSCAVETVDLSGLGSSEGNEFSYQWTTVSGNIVSGVTTLTPTVDQPATYDLLVTNTANDCTSTASVDIQADENAPLSVAGPTSELNCTTENVDLDATQSSQGAGIEFSWATTDGNIAMGANTLTPNVNEAGTYTLSVLDTNNGCETSSTVTITQDITLPDAFAGTAETLNCTLTQLNLDATGTSAGDEFIYLWTTSDGNVLSGDNTLSPEIDEPGTYNLLVTNTANNCQQMDALTVLENVTPPTATIESPELLTCTNENFNLSGMGSSTGSNFAYTWTTMDGNILMGMDGLSPEIDAAGTYTLLVVDTDNNCETTTSQLVEQDVNYPIITIAEPTELNCMPQFQTALLNGIGSSTGDEFSYQWTTVDGSIAEGSTSSNAVADAPGTYTFTITNMDNDCVISQEVEVLQDIESPLADAGQDLEINCTNQMALTDGSNSSVGTEFTYQWSTNNGNYTGDEASTSISVNQVGTYTLVVTDTSNGCTSEDALLVTSDDQIPTVNIAEPAMLNCIVDAVSLSSTTGNGVDLELTWTTTNGNILTGEDTPTPDVDEPGIYNLLVSNPNNGCTTTQMVTVLQDIENPTADAGEGAELTCTVTEVELNGTGSTGTNFSYDWTTADGNILNGVTDLTPIVNQVGDYNLLVINTENGCTSSDIVTISLNAEVPVNINASVVEPPCFGEPATIIVDGIDGGIAPFQYSLDGDTYTNETIFNNLSDGTDYTVYLLDANGCELETTLNIPFIPEVTVDIIPEVEIEIGEMYELNTLTNIPEADIQSITWTPNTDLTCTDCLTPTSSATNTTTYTVTVVNQNGCEDSANILLRVDREINVYIPNAFSPYDENGVNDKFTIFSQDGAITNIKSLHVYDRWGTKIAELYDFPPNDTTYGWDGTYKGERLDPAVFIFWAEVELITGTTEFFKGDLTLMK